MSGFKVFLADDERMIREGIASLIPWEEQNLHFIGSARDGLIAYEDIIRLRPDIVITDIRMPKMNGLELIQRVKEGITNIHFIVLSGYGELELAAQAMQLGVRHYLLKPCDEQEIIHVLKEIIKDLEDESC
ncbi:MULTISPECIES: response regulator [unclassified Paenibacillus]|uniref:response regulator n=1 Tax=unclassified Paenibacillus TaxID=185978 RepID=UPI00362A83FB